MLTLSESHSYEKFFPCNPFVLVFWLIWIQRARIVRLEQINNELAAEVDRLRGEGKRAAA